MRGRSLTDRQKRRIMELLLNSDISLKAIAESVGCSRSAVISYNRKHAVRRYQGNRTRWTVIEDKIPRAS